MLLNLAAACLALSAWLLWWETNGTSLVDGYPFQPEALLSGQPLVFAAIAALSVASLLAWLAPAAAEVAPSLRRVVLVGVLGGACGWAAMAGAMAYLHARQPAVGEPLDPFISRYFRLVFVAWLVAMAVAAIVANVLSGRHRLLTALIAAQVAALVGFGGMFALAASDGCVPALDTLGYSCVWHPGATWSMFAIMVGPALALAVIIAVGATVTVSVVRRAWHHTDRPSVRRRSAGNGRAGLVARRFGVAGLCAAVVCAAATAELINIQQQRAVGPNDTSAAVVDLPVSTQVRAFQLGAWETHGGLDILQRYATTTKRFVTMLENGHGEINGAAVRPFCAKIDQIGRDAADYFQAPDPPVQALWQTFIKEVRTSGQDCGRSVDQSNGDLIIMAIQHLDMAGAAADSLETQLLALNRTG
ncbi:MAG TPA: hypothetical protein VFX16_29210 [Pseudonocardiaceae bacterium]|nr:hypothetical protein [Pseudonocardiaceae bacterium]